MELQRIEGERAALRQKAGLKIDLPLNSKEGSGESLDHVAAALGITVTAGTRSKRHISPAKGRTHHQNPHQPKNQPATARRSRLLSALGVIHPLLARIAVQRLSGALALKCVEPSGSKG